MNKEVKITISVDGVDKEIKSVGDLKEAVSELGKSTEETSKKTSFFGEKLKSIKSFFGDIKNQAKGLQNDFVGFAKGIGLSDKAAKGLALSLSALGLPILLAVLGSIIEFFKNFEAGIKLVEKATNVLNAALGQLTDSLVKLFSGDFKGFINSFKQIGDAAIQAAKDTDILFESQRRLSELTIKNTEENAKLRQELKLAQKVVQDGTASYEERVKALEDIERVEQKLLENKREEIKSQREILEANLRLENNQLEQRKIQEQLAGLKAEEIDLETELSVKRGTAAKQIRQLDLQRIKEAQDRNEKLLEIESKFNEDLIKLAQENELLNIEDIQQRETRRLEIEQENAIRSINRSQFNEEQKQQLILQTQEKYLILQQQLEQKYRLDREKAEKEELDRQIKQREDNLARLEKILEKVEIDSIENAFERSRTLLDIEEKRVLDELDLLGASEEDKLKVIESFNKKRRKLNEEEQQFNIELARAEFDAKLDIFAGTFQAIANLVGEQSAFGKATAIAAATIDTYRAANLAIATIPPPFGQIAAGASIIQGLANVRKILSVQTPGNKQAPIPIVDITQPTAPFDPTASLGNVNLRNPTEGIDFGSQTTIKAFVVASDMTAEQEKERKLQNLNRL